MILVTGATGHIGNVLVRELVGQGYPLRALILPGEDASSLNGLAVEKVTGNVLDPASLKIAFQNVTLAFHLAGMISILPGRNDLVRRVNVEGTRNVLQAAREAGAQRLIYTSSIHALRRIPHGTVIDERVPFDPRRAISSYDRSKAEATLIVKEETERGLDAVIACPTGVIGPYDYRRSEMGQLIWEMMRQKVVFLVKGAYDFVDVRDVAHGLIQAALIGRRGAAYILSGHQIDLFQLLRTVQEVSGMHPSGVCVPTSLAKLAAPLSPWFAVLFQQRALFTTYSLATVLSNSVISSAKAQHDLGFQARPIAESIADTIHWWRKAQAALAPPARQHQQQRPVHS